MPTRSKEHETQETAPRPDEQAGDGQAAREAPRHDYRPEGASPGSGWWPTLKRTASEFREDKLTDWAAALTYYGLLSLFPALIALVSIVGLFGNPQSTTNKLTEIVTSIGPATAAKTFEGPINSITSNRGTAGIGLVLGVLVALWSASGYIGAFMRASNIIYETPEGRPAWKLRPLQILVALVMVILITLVALALALTGPVVEKIFEPLGVSHTATVIWDIAKWPVLAIVFVLMIDILYYASPNVKLRGFRWVTPGAIAALVAWIAASVGFAFYVANFGSYDKTYGTLGGVVVLLVWFWITNVSILFGHQLNSERERSLQLQEGRPRADRELQMEPRGEPARQKTS